MGSRGTQLGWETHISAHILASHSPPPVSSSHQQPWLSRWTRCLPRKEKQRVSQAQPKKEERMPRHLRLCQPRLWEEPPSNLRDGIGLDGSRLSTHCQTPGKGRNGPWIPLSLASIQGLV